VREIVKRETIEVSIWLADLLASGLAVILGRVNVRD
jgi:hypothetical protein